MSGVFFYTLVASFVSGIFLRSFFIISWPVCLWFVILSLGVIGLWYKKRSFNSSHVLLWSSIALCGFGFGLLRLELQSAFTPVSLFSEQVGTSVTLRGQVIREPDVRTRSRHLVVQVQSEKILVQTDRHVSVSYGDMVEVQGKLTVPEAFITDLGRSFDYQKYLAAQGITYTMSFADVTVIDAVAGNALLRFLFTQKAAFMDALELVIPEPEVALGEGLILGTKQALGEELETAFRRAGIIHIVVLSGYNIMLVVTFVMYVLGWFLPERARLIAGGISIILFALLVGLGASVVRASIMAVIALFALALGRRYAVLRALCVAGVLMLLVNPLLLVSDVGFQLSFMATLGLILVAPQFEVILAGRRGWFSIKDFMIATLATQVAVLPLLLYHIGEFSVVAVFVNILVLPIVSLAMLGTFLTGIVALMSLPLALPCAMVTYGLLTYIIVIATFFAGLPFAALTVPEFPFIVVVLMYLILGYGLYRRQQRNIPVPTLHLPTSPREWTVEVVTDGTPETSGRLTSGVAVIQNEQGQSPRSPESNTPIFFR